VNFLRREIVLAIAFAIVTGVWLNQSVGGKDWEALRDRVFAAPNENIVEYLRYPFVFAYRRSHDEEIYYATASAIVGRPFPPEFLDRGGVPDAFSSVQPTDDGRFRVPYAEVPLEYPPTALPFVVAPRLVASSYEGYARVFGALMAACLTAACAIAIRVSKRLGDGWSGSRRWWIAIAIVLAHGAMAIQRLDAVVALLLALALDAALRRKPALLGLWIGLAAANKITPGLLLALFVAADWPFYKRRKNAATLLGASAAACAIGFAPLVLSGGLADFLAYHGKRGLHVESTFGIVYGVARAIAGRANAAILDYGSFNFHGDASDGLARASSLVLVALVAIATWLIARSPSFDDEPSRTRRVACAAIAGCAAIWLGGKVFSPQYLTWAIPLALAVHAADARRVILPLFAATLLSQIYIRGYYDHVYEQRPVGLATLLVRQAVLVALFVWATRAARRPARAIANANATNAETATPMASGNSRGE
jgi:hypothetical protein